MVLNSFAEMHGKDDEIWLSAKGDKMPYKIEFKKDHTNPKENPPRGLLSTRTVMRLSAARKLKKPPNQVSAPAWPAKHGGFKNKS